MRRVTNYRETTPGLPGGSGRRCLAAQPQRGDRRDRRCAAARGTWKVIESSHEAERVNANLLGFTVTVPAGGQLEVSYRVQLGR
jgi:hypothetical protein